MIFKPASSGSREVIGLKKSYIINNKLGEVAEDEVGYKKGEEN
nr:hypothetical protein [Nonlabens sp. Ci31]